VRGGLNFVSAAQRKQKLKPLSDIRSITCSGMRNGAATTSCEAVTGFGSYMYPKLSISAMPKSLDVARLTDLESKYLDSSPEVKERVSRTIERGPIAALVKRANGFRCQLCAALGRDPIGFKKKNGEPYVEAHHVMPVSIQQIGSLAALNVLTLCANHHREVHFGCVEIVVHNDVFEVLNAGERVQIPRFKLLPLTKAE